MTQEHPQRLCYNCRQPVGRATARVRGEVFCSDMECRQVASAMLTGGA